MNLLPITEKDNIKKGLKLRLLVFISIIVSASFLAGIIMLVPAYMLASGNFSQLSSEQTSSVSDDSTKQLLNLPEEVSVKTKFLQNYNKSVSVTNSFEAVIKYLPEGVKIDSISFNKDKIVNEKISANMTISGIASNREKLVTFSNSLKDSGKFFNVDVPVSNLTKDKDLPFTINLVIE